MSRIRYQPMEDDHVEVIGNIQSNTDDVENVMNECRPLLPYWPYWLGLFQIAVGFLSLSFGVVEMWILPFLISVEGHWAFVVYNSYGAGMWTGITLVFAGCLALRTAKTRALQTIQQFYVVTLLAFLVNLSFMILMIWCSKHWTDTSLATYFTQDSDHSSIVKGVSDVEQVYKVLAQLESYTWISMVTCVWCLIGCLLLFLAVCNYFMPCVFGEVQLLRSLGICCCPCLLNKNPPSHGSSIQSMSSSESNLIV